MSGDVSPDIPAGTPIFRAYGEGFFQIGNERIETGILLHQGEITSPWGPESLQSLRLEDLKPVMEQAPEVLLIGTGRTTAFPDVNILTALEEKHIGFECMDSRAAARTYNVLIGEGRNVSAAMLLPQA